MFDFITLHQHDNLYTTQFKAPLFLDNEEDAHVVMQDIFTTNLPGFHRAFLQYLNQKFEENTEDTIEMFPLDTFQLWISEYTQVVLTLLHQYSFQGIYFRLDSPLLDENMQDIEVDICIDTRKKSEEIQAYLYFVDQLYETMLVVGFARNNMDIVWSTLCDKKTKEMLEKLQREEIRVEEFEDYLQDA